ncbi:MAG: glycoside hydrolase family 3 N-terminal domain-containing protein [Candidatus Marinimicrobia bacterium]|nr:glycoside hydrolase family 3 N-terminal domain-containing protein [Candidatus Neomarinimicrobiota bacterium]
MTVFILFSCQSNDGSKTSSDTKHSTLVSGKLIDRSSETPTDSALYKNSELPIMDRVRDLMSYMTIEEKVGQMTQVERQFLDGDDNISKYFLGSLLSGGGSAPAKNFPRSWADMYDRFQKVALSTRLGIPIIYGIDAVHGHGNVVGATIFPHHIGLGCTNNPKIVEEVYRATAVEVAATGVDWNFAPCLAVPRDERWGRTYEGFGETPEIVKSMAAAAVVGLQTDKLNNPTSILATAKHFLGDGGTLWGTGLDKKLDQGDTQVSEQEMREIHLPGYFPALEAGVGTVMPSYSKINGTYMHMNNDLLNGLLKKELGFGGFVISDWAALERMVGHPADSLDGYKKNIIASINAGIDMVMVPGAVPHGNQSYNNFIKLLIEAIKEGAISESRINDAVARILKIKFEMGLFENPLTDRSLLNKVGSKEHRSIARNAVKQSLVMLKNNGVLPISKDLGQIHVAGKNADDLGNQCGGWTISWQGESGPLTKGTTIYEAIQVAASSFTNVTYSKDGSGAKGANVGIVVVGETPYSEMQGDKESLYLDKKDLKAIENIQKAGVPVVVIIVSGRPLIIEDQVDKWDGLIAAWLPGSEGKGVTDVLFGDYNPTGRLSVSWPRSMDQIPINFGDKEYDPLFEYGFGLSY